jgi:signal transduction histidine kinase
VQVGVHGDVHGLRITVADDGCGFDPAPAADGTAEGFGLPSIRAQMRAIGGQLDIDAVPDRGTCAMLTLSSDHPPNPGPERWAPTLRAPGVASR